METSKVKQFIYSKLNGDSVITSLISGRVFDGYVPESVSATQFPAVIYSLYSPGDDLINVGGFRVWADLSYIIKVIDKSSNFVNSGVIADRIDFLMHRASSATYSIESCIRMRPIEYRETLPQVEYVHIGGIYNFKVTT